jgi:hypothetical protein
MLDTASQFFLECFQQSEVGTFKSFFAFDKQDTDRRAGVNQRYCYFGVIAGDLFLPDNGTLSFQGLIAKPPSFAPGIS